MNVYLEEIYLPEAVEIFKVKYIFIFRLIAREREHVTLQTHARAREDLTLIHTHSHKTFL